ncbi:MAG: SDR family oxidoreductase [Bacilli bacterium]|nr:SDR family oxidoreductase [Bacilli bacterium]
MKALITGASSGIGSDIARVLSNYGYDLILVARRKTRLSKLKSELKTNVDIISMDISSTFNCMELYNQVKNEEIEILVNCAGFGVFGDFTTTSLDKELDMIDTNIKGLHILTKLFLQDFTKRNRGYILNVASAAAFGPGPLMAGYYASKAYVLRLSESIYGELKEIKSNVGISTLCPGPVDTEFNKVAKVKFSIKPLNSMDVAEYAIKKMFKKKLIIIPGKLMKLNYIFNRFIPTKVLLKINYNIQSKKEG